MTMDMTMDNKFSPEQNSNSKSKCNVLEPSHQDLYSSPALFNIHINDLEDSDDLDVDTTECADDCSEDKLVEQGISSSMQVAIDYVCK